MGQVNRTYSTNVQTANIWPRRNRARIAPIRRSRILDPGVCGDLAETIFETVVCLAAAHAHGIIDAVACF